jgi:hypothetical protein
MSGLSEEVWRGDSDKVLCGERRAAEAEWNPQILFQGPKLGFCCFFALLLKLLTFEHSPHPLPTLAALSLRVPRTLEPLESVYITKKEMKC